MNIKKIGVAGAGVIGIGVAHSLAQTGHEVVLTDISDEILLKSKDEIISNVRFQSFFNKEESYDPDEIVNRITFTTDYSLFGDVDFVVENVTENWGIKKEVFKNIDSICPDHCVFASNTSCIPITKSASVTKRKDRVLGIHFMNPVPLKKTVELIRGFHTSAESIETAKTLLAQMGKEAIVVNDSPGFVSNRVLMLMINEAIFLLHEGVSTANDIDQIFKSCFEHKMGPLETADLIGLDTILYSLDVLYESFNDSKYRPCTLLKKMVDAGLSGRKSGQGFYTY
jgi:3-hydroxybutyryl-CoA dehydrogenase